MVVGIEKINLYGGQLYLEFADLAKAKGEDWNYLSTNVMCDQRSLYPAFEDAVTLAVNAAKRLLTPQDIADIELLIVSTESAVDMGKATSTWVHRFCELPAYCRNFEIKHACFGCTGALKMAATWVASDLSPGKKALVINTDASRMHTDLGRAEFVGGGGAVAMLISNTPHVLEMDLAQSGYWTSEIADTFRPTSRVEAINDQASLYAYLDALEGSYTHFQTRTGISSYEDAFKKHIYHAPFPGMTLVAHRTLLNRDRSVSKKEVNQSFHERVAESLFFSRRMGSLYGGSTFVGLLGLLHTAQDLHPGDPISLFAYGSGCQGEFYSAQIGQTGSESVRNLDITSHLDQRHQVTVTEYETLEKNRAEYIDLPDYEPNFEIIPGIYDSHYQGKNLLVLKRVENYHRHYEWS